MKLLGVRAVEWVRSVKLDFVWEIGLDNHVDSFHKVGIVGCRIGLVRGTRLGGHLFGGGQGLVCRESGT